MKFKEYPSYKNSGVEWLGDIPEHWSVIPSKFYFIERKEKAENTDKQLTASQKHGIIFQEDFMAENGRVMVVMKNPEILKKVRPNDFVISMRSFQGGLELSYLEGSISSAYVMLKPNLNVVDIEYFKYLFKTPRYIQSLQSTSNLIRDGQALRFNNFSQVKLILPPKSDQQNIVSFLDTETARIDNLIAKQEKLIELLEEQRKSIISHAVTKGLNPDVPMKDSGVEWLGKVPEHWIISRVKFNFRNLDSKRIPLTSEERSYRQGDYPYYGASGIIDYVDSFIFEEDLVLFSEDGANLAYRNMPISFVAKGKYWVNNHAHILKPFDNLTAYWACVLESVDVNLSITGATQPKVTAENLGNICISFPPIFEERLSINNYILEESLKIDTLILKQNQLIEKLKEYRSSIISHAVTGKIDVREYA